MKPKSRALPAAVCLAVVLAGGIIVLLQMSFTPGNVYPPYSTLRSDPLGASALMESLQAVPGQQASRNYQSLPRLIQYAGATFVELGGDFEAGVMQSPQDYAYLEQLLAAGSRLVILSAPVVDNLPTERKKKAKSEEAKAEKPVEEEKQQDEVETPPSGKDKTKPKKIVNDDVSLCEKWGFSLYFLPVAAKSEAIEINKPPVEEAFPTEPSDSLKPLHWSSYLAFRDPDPAWTILYEKNGHPVLMERAFGNGSIVLGTDAYFVSNEALRSDRRTDLILRVLGPGSNIIFSETQHGLHESTGLAGLLRRYQLHGTLACLALLAGLFVWRSVFSLIPPAETESPRSITTEGPTARDGMTHLLQRNLSPIQAFQEGMERWLKSCGKAAPQETRVRAQDYLFELRSNKKLNLRAVPEIYKTLQTMLTERK